VLILSIFLFLLSITLDLGEEDVDEVDGDKIDAGEDILLI